jgi:adenine-specific DNA-methyltransferase
MSRTTKLELTWIGKDISPRLEPRILLEDGAKSYHARTRLSEKDFFDNRLIFGDNLLALRSLEQEFTGKVKCIYIDPPYNTGSAYEHYDDGVEHSIWLSMMRARLELLRTLLRPDGFIFVQIDNNEMAYLKVLMDEIFGRENFINDIIWKRRGGSANPNNRLNNVTDFILWYSKSQNYEIVPIFTKDDENTQKYIKERFVLKDENGRLYRKSPLESPNPRPNLMYEYKGYKPPKNGWSISPEKMEEWDRAGKLDFPQDKNQAINRRVYLDEYVGQPVPNLWTDISVINPMSKERLNFDGQKPEALIERIFSLCTKEGDWVLDSFGGSGTTAAVAQKMSRRWITVELRDHCDTHILPRLRKVIDGKDVGGITEKLKWSGGGGFRYYRLAPSLLQKDKFGNWVVSKQYNAGMLAEAMCKFEGFTYAPSNTEYWMHGYSTERDFIYVTTQTLTREQLQKLSDEVGENRSLLACCSAFRVKDVSQFPNLTIKKIPKMVLNRCEWGRDDYSLEIKNLPEAPPLLEPPPVAPTNGRRKTTNGSMPLFEAAAEGSHNR